MLQCVPEIRKKKQRISACLSTPLFSFGLTLTFVPQGFVFLFFVFFPFSGQ